MEVLKTKHIAHEYISYAYGVLVDHNRRVREPINAKPVHFFLEILREQLRELTADHYFIKIGNYLK